MTSFFDKIGWFPGIGDPSLMGWFTVFAYFFTAYKSRGAARVLRSSLLGSRETVLWFGLALLLMFLGINKQLDLQSFFTSVAKYHAQQTGWYADRRALQLVFIAVIAAVACVVAAALFFVYRKVMSRHMLAITGVSFLLAFVFIRASSFHDLDSFLGSNIKGVRFNWILELGGIGLIYVNSLSLIRNSRPKPASSDRKIDIIR